MKFRTDRPPTWQACGECGNELPVNDACPRCPVCGGLLELQHRPPDLTRDELIERFNTRQRRGLDAPASGVWRFRDVVLPNIERVVSHPEGNTPLLHREALDRFTGLSRLLLKHEGHNPTGSFKDRGMTVGVTQAVRLGAAAVACASTGNTSASLAAYAAQAGIPALVLVPAGNVALGKLAQSLAYGARTLLVRGDFDDCLRLAEGGGRQVGGYLPHFIKPFPLPGGGRAGSWASISSIRSIRSGSRGRRRSCWKCCSSWGGSRRTGSCSPRATSATRPRSGRRCWRRTGGD